MIRSLALKFHFRTLEETEAPKFAGAAWRGAFGYALKRTVCLMKQRPCAGCPFEHSCAYPFIFETRPASDAIIMGKADRLPHPFVLQPPLLSPKVEPNSVIIVGMNLIGSATRHLPYIIHAMADAGKRGIGKNRSHLALEAVSKDDGEIIWTYGGNLSPQTPSLPLISSEAPKIITLNFLSPLRFIREGKPIKPEYIDGETIALSAIRRVHVLASLYDTPIKSEEVQLYKSKSKQIHVLSSKLSWSDRRRFSTRQDRLITTGGVLGSVTLDIADAPQLFPFFKIAETVHIGKGATLGFGQIKVYTESEK